MLGTNIKLNLFTLSLARFCVIYGSVSFPYNALANVELPDGGVVIAGEGSIEYSGNKLNVHQLTPKMINEWITFNIGEGASVEFFQPNENAISLNRVISDSPTSILGNLSANGQVFLINDSGVVFGENSRVDTAGLLVSTLNMTNEDFLSGNYKFTGGDTAGNIVQLGEIETKSGKYIAFIAPNISNQGSLVANEGSVSLIAGDKVNVDFGGDGLITYEVEQGLINSLVTNKGSIIAANGAVVMTSKARGEIADSIVNNEGVIKATGFSSKGGRVFLNAEGGKSVNAGVIDVSSENGTGGTVRHLGKEVVAEADSFYNASGNTGGGTVEIGGSWQNSNPDVAQAQKTTIHSGSLITANAITKGNGGQIVAWSDLEDLNGQTGVHGTLEARGGTENGNGGRIETSGRKISLDSIQLDLNAPNGKNGTWLIDPTDITIRDSGTTTPGASDLPNYEGATDGSFITTADIEGQLNAGTNVVIQTGSSGTQVGNISVNGAIEKTSGGDASLTLKAHKNIFVRSSIQSSSSKLDIVLQSNIADDASGGGGVLISGANTNINTNGGDLTVTGGSNGLDGTLASNGTQRGFELNRASIDAGGGDVYIKANGNGTFNAVGLLSSSIETNGEGAVHIIGNSGTNSTGILIPEFDSSGDGFANPNSVVAGSGGLTIEANGQGLSGSRNGFVIGYGSLTAVNPHEFKAVGGDINIVASSSGGSSTANDDSGLYSKTKASFTTTGTGDINFDLSSQHGAGLKFDGLVIVNSAGSINVNAASDNASAISSRDSQPTEANNVVFQTGSGDISITADSDAPNAIQLNHGNYSFQSITGHISLISDSVDFSSSNTSFNSIGEFTIKTHTEAKATTIGTSGSGLVINPLLFGDEISNSFSTINIGSSSHTGGISVDEDVDFNSHLALLQGAGDISLNAKVEVPQFNTIRLQTDSNTSQSATGALVGGNLLLLGTGGHVLDSALNDVNKLAANTGSLSYTNKDGIDINAISGVSGINATGAVSLKTLSTNALEDIKISQSISTTDTTQNAIMINAGVDEAAGDTSLLTDRADIVYIDGTIETGTGGRATLMTGSVAGSTSLAAQIDGGHFRYGSDEVTTNYSSALDTGTYLIYRERPTLNLAVDDMVKTYDSEAFSTGTYSATGYVNDDAANHQTNVVYGGTAIGAVNAGTYTLNATRANSGLGYDVTTTDGSLTIDKARLVVVAPSDTIMENGQPYSPMGNIDYQGFVGNETQDDLTGEAVLSGNALGAVDPGVYELLVSGLDSNNYEIEYVAGEVEILRTPEEPPIQEPDLPSTPEQPEITLEVPEVYEPDWDVKVDNTINVDVREPVSLEDVQIENAGSKDQGYLSLAVDFSVVEYIDGVPSNTIQNMSFVKSTDQTRVLNQDMSFGLTELPGEPEKMRVFSFEAQQGGETLRYKVDLFDSDISIQPLDKISQVNLQNDRKKSSLMCS